MRVALRRKGLRIRDFARDNSGRSGGRLMACLAAPALHAAQPAILRIKAR